jgi:RecA/RadA recombinase
MSLIEGFRFKSALEHYNQGGVLKMSTGSCELDSLLDGIEEGQLYLFYGHPIPLDSISHRLMVNCVKPRSEQGFESMAICINSTDYSGRERMVLNPEKIANVAKAAKVEPKIVAKNLFIQTAYDSQHQVRIAKEVSNLVEENHDIKLILLNNFTKFFKESNGQRKYEVANSIKEVISIITKACVENKIAIAVTGDAGASSKGIIPRPIGGSFLKHLANVIVYVKNLPDNMFSPKFIATLVKHQYIKTPKHVMVHGRRGRKMMLFN